MAAYSGGGQGPVHAVVPSWPAQAAPHAPAPRPQGFFSFWLPVLMVFLLTFASLAASFVAFVLHIRPILKQAERAAAAAEAAARQMDVAAKEMEKVHLLCGGGGPAVCSVWGWSPLWAGMQSGRICMHRGSVTHAGCCHRPTVHFNLSLLC